MDHDATFPPFLADQRVGEPAHELCALLAQVSHTYFKERFNRVAADLDITPAQAFALLQLTPGDPISQRELAKRLHCAPSSVVDPTDRLEARGWVRRQVDQADRRVNALIVTEAGARVREALTDRLFQPPPPIARLPLADQIKFRDALRELLTATESGG